MVIFCGVVRWTDIKKEKKRRRKKSPMEPFQL